MDKFLTKEQLEKLNTKRLLAYKNKLMQYTYNGCGYEDCTECMKDYMCKARPEWQQTYNDLKTILSTREHIEK